MDLKELESEGIKIPQVGQWCNVDNAEYEVIKVSDSGTITLETIFLGEILERKMLLTTLVKQIEDKGFYKPTKTQLETRDRVKKELKVSTEMIEAPKKELNESQKLFCKYYLDPEHYGNGLQAYMKVYKCSYEGAKNGASRLLRNEHICTHIATLLDDAGFNDNNVDKQLLHIINQMDDLSAKNAAIREYNKLRQRIVDKIEHSGNIGQEEDYRSMSTAELERRKKAIQQESDERND